MTTPPPEADLARAGPRPELHQIGRPGKPIRALAFAGGGFDTAMQLGVVHALLVSRGRAPDVVIGCSAGAVNAVALAEVLQAGDIGERVTRFREIYDQYLRAPGLILGAALPDTYQVDTQRPLEPLRLPIHHRLERAGRLAAVAVRAGVINLYNTLLSIHVSIGTMTRAARRWLGFQAAGNIQQPLLRRLIQAGELLRAWMLLGANVAKLAPLARLLIDGAVQTQPKEEHGATAGGLIFQSRLWAAIRRRGEAWIGLLLFAALWVLVSALVPALIGIGPVLLLVLLPGGPPPDFLGITLPAAVLLGTVLLALVFGIVAEPLPDESLQSLRQKASYVIGVALRTLPRAVWATVVYALLMVLWSAVVAGLAGAPLLVELALTLLAGAPPDAAAASEGRRWVIVIGAVIVAAAIAAVQVIRGRNELGIGLLRLFNLDRSLLHPQPLRELLINLFDPKYYGELNVDRVVESALRNKNDPADSPRSEKYLEDYAQTTKAPPIHVLVTVADVATSDFDFLPGSYRVIDGLVAALAAPPLFPPVTLGRRVFVDGSVVANDPARPLFRFLRHAADVSPPLVDPRAAVLHLYSVSPIPLSTPWLGSEPDERQPNQSREYTNLVDVVRRALTLQRFRDAKLERTLSELHTKAMPQDGTLFYPEQPTGDQKRHVRTWVYPVEPERPLNVNETLLAAENEIRGREVIAETVADGCRAALAVMIRDSVQAAAQLGMPGASSRGPLTALCREAVADHFTRQQMADVRQLPGSAEQVGDNGPGLAEVCAHCVLFRERIAAPHAAAPGAPPVARPPRRSSAPWTPPSTPTSVPAPRSLAWEPHRPAAPPWPMEGTRQDEPDWRDPPHESRDPSADAAAPWGDVWPRARQVEGRRLAGLERPTVSFLFSGGVFRGVFQVGVLNGLSEAGLVPDVVAGASVGSITAAMAASAYFGTATLAAPQPLAARQAAIRRLAAAYLAIDRLVLTDRFADFIRGITVRAAQSRFSIRQADRVIRRYDDANSWSWSQEVRSVAAGLERLAYLSPFELVELVEAFRRQNPRRVADLLREDLQEFLNRAGVGAEVLGAEPLALLIREYVLEALARAPDARLDGMRFHEFLERGLVFLATTTNLTDGHLVVLGEEQLLAGGQSIVLPQSLLASSAFPAVFRPRWEWELRPQTGAWRQYIDGGVVDNLPLDAVAQFLSTAARSRLIERRPLVPHLVFSASLETETAKIDADDRELDELLRNWPRLLRRAQRLGYNKKLEMFTRTQRNLRAIMAERRRGGPLEPGRDYVPLDLWVTTVIPKWLCGTFAFHPMLGFRQWKQAASIAHGCASTLLALGYEAALPRGGAARAVAWGMDQSLLPAAAQCTAPDPFARQAEPAERGNCWYRPAVPCPFAAQARDGPRRTAAALAEIYDRCGHAATHRPQ